MVDGLQVSNYVTYFVSKHCVYTGIGCVLWNKFCCLLTSIIAFLPWAGLSNGSTELYVTCVCARACMHACVHACVCVCVCVCAFNHAINS